MNLISMLTVFRNARGLILAGVLATASSCDLGDRSGLSVAGGKNDEEGKYSSTFYVELRGYPFGNKNEKIIRNVGTIVDAGLPKSYILVLSLADVYEPIGNMATLPLFETAKLRLFQGKDKTIEFNQVIMKEGFLEDTRERRFRHKMFFIGAKVDGSVDQKTDATKDRVKPYHMQEFPLKLSNGTNLRDRFSNFVLLSIPKDHPNVKDLKVPKLMSAEARPPEATEAEIVGYGETEVGTKKGGFSLSDELPGIRGRNYAKVQILRDTPLSKRLSDNMTAKQQIWEIGGSGLCRSTAKPLAGEKNSPNYDTGAAVYINGQFAGFGVRSTAKSTGYKDILNCLQTSADDMVTMIVSVSDQHIAAFRSQLGE